MRARHRRYEQIVSEAPIWRDLLMIVFGWALMLVTRSIWYWYGSKRETVPLVRIQVRRAKAGQASTVGSSVTRWATL